MASTTLGWKVIGCSAVGTSHAHLGLPCQDAHASLTMPDGTLILVMADGAGSSSRAGEGSNIVTRNAVGFLERGLCQQLPESDEAWTVLLRDTLRYSRQALVRNVGAGQLHDFATTVLLVIATQETLASAQIGDGAIVYRNIDGKLDVLTPVSDHEYINETSFLTGLAFEQDTNCRVLSSVEVNAIALLSDGLQPLAIQYPKNVPYHGFFNPLFTFAGDENADQRELDTFLYSSQVNERTDDDKSLLLAVRNVAA